MDSAKNAVKSFLSKDGKHDTTVHSSTAPAVTNETVDQHRHDNIIKATDREIHQDHYHTTVQPVHDTQKLKEQHHFKTAAVEERKFEHGNDEEVQSRLRAEQAKFQDSTRQGETKHTTATGGNLSSEHVHHHVHENVQPVIHRQTIEPHVVHTTIPVHETHHSAAKHHGTTELPAVSLDQFKSQGGSLGASKGKTEFFEGEPREGTGHLPLKDNASHTFRETGHKSQHEGGLTGSHHNTGATGSGLTGSSGTTGTGLTGSHHNTGATGTGLTGSSGTTGTGLTGSHHNTGATGTGLTGSSGTTGAGLTGSHHTGTTGTTGTSGTTGTGLTGDRHTGTTGTTGSHHTDTTGTSTSGTTTGTKPSLLDRLNPLKDADGDGKKGLMD